MKLYPATLRGGVRVPPSKSLAHRAIICAALAEGTSRLSPVDFSDDIRATLGGMERLGVKAAFAEGDTLTITGGGTAASMPEIDCIESGSTLRFLMPISMVKAGGGVFLGRGKLGTRPLQPFADICAKQGADFRQTGVQPMRVEISGSLQSGDFMLPGNVSSQFASGLLFCLPLLAGDSRIRFDAPPESVGYIHLTLDAMHAFGVEARWASPTELSVPGGQRYRACAYAVEGDYSQAAVFLCAGALGADVTVRGLSPNSHQGDAAVLAHLERLGAVIEHADGGLRARAAGLRGAVIDAADCPDIAPILALTAALAEGESELVHAGRLRLKECDRLHATAAIINALGGCAEELPDGLRIRGVKQFAGGCAVSSYGDHRMAMLASVAALRCASPIELDDAACVSKSYPDYWKDYTALGGLTNG